MTKILLSLIAVCFLCSYNYKTEKPAKSKWIKLFDGKTTKGWHTYGKPSAGKVWKVEDGSLHLDPTVRKMVKGEEGDLVSNEEFDNFDLKLDWKIAKNGNSGIMIFVNENAAKNPTPYMTGPEIQVLDNEGHPDAKIFKHRAGDLYDLIPSTKETVKPFGEWNHAEIVANKGKLDIYLNGEHSVSTTMWDDNWRKMIAGSKFKSMPDFGTFHKGHIDLQDHGDEVWFKDIMIKKL
ncbi:MAG: DUF1080 domain-containing protein [Ginsengibacter sp.]